MVALVFARLLTALASAWTIAADARLRNGDRQVRRPPQRIALCRRWFLLLWFDPLDLLILRIAHAFAALSFPRLSASDSRVFLQARCRISVDSAISRLKPVEQVSDLIRSAPHGDAWPTIQFSRLMPTCLSSAASSSPPRYALAARTREGRSNSLANAHEHPRFYCNGVWRGHNNALNCHSREKQRRARAQVHA